MFTQLFETTVVGDGDGRAIKFVFLPRGQMPHSMRSLFEPEKKGLWKSFDTMLELGLEVQEGLHFPHGDPQHGILEHMKLLPYMIAGIGSYPTGSQALQYLNRVKFHGYSRAPEGDEKFLDLARDLVDAPIVPIAQSPLDLSSLTDIIKSGSGVGIGATVGFLVGWGTPYLFVAVPAGMLVCGAAAGISKALDKGLESMLLSWLGVEESEGRP